MFKINIYKKKLNKKATELQQTKFGRIIILVAGIIIGLCAMSLDGVSLLMIDIFSGILFAAPAAALILGLWLPKINTTVSFVLVFAGFIACLLYYIVIIAVVVILIV